MKQRLARGDLLWLLAAPLYILIGTLRHELSHAIVALLLGARIEQFVFWPTWSEGSFRWGYVVWYGREALVVTVGPYLCDLAMFALFFMICKRIRFRRHWVWVNLVIIGLISPLLNSAYNYVRGLMGSGDVAKLLGQLPTSAVHAYFGVTLCLYLVGLIVLLGPEVRLAVRGPDCGVSRD
jgi:hypothetical protein